MAESGGMTEDESGEGRASRTDEPREEGNTEQRSQKTGGTVCAEERFGSLREFGERNMKWSYGKGSPN